MADDYVSDDGIREELEELRTYGRPLDLQVDELTTLLEEILLLRSLARDLAANHPGAVTETYGDPYCTLCDGATEDPPVHDPECPWRRAVEWAEAHPDA